MPQSTLFLVDEDNDKGWETSSTTTTSAWIFILVLTIALAVAVHRILIASQRMVVDKKKVDMEEVRKRRLEKAASSQINNNNNDSPASPSSSPAQKKKPPPNINDDDSVTEKKGPTAAKAKMDATTTSSNNNNTNSDTTTKTTTTTTKKKKPPVSPSPVHQLCFILSTILEASVVLQGTLDDYSSPATSPSPTKLRSKKQQKLRVTLPMMISSISSMDTSSAEELSDLFAETLVTTTSQCWFYQAKPSASGHVIRWLLQRHDRLVVNLANHHAAATSNNNNKNNNNAILRLCLEKLQTWIWQQLHDRLAPEVTISSTTTDHDNDDDDMPALFADETPDDDNNNNNNALLTVNVGTNTQEWLTLLEDMSPSLTPTLLEGVLSLYATTTATITTTSPNHNNNRMATFWMQEICRRLEMAYEHPSMEAVTLLPRRWNAFSHYWQQCTTVRQLYAQQWLLSNNDKSDTARTRGVETGTTLEDNVPWAILCRGAAFCVPTSQLDQGPSSLFGHVLIQSVASQEPNQVGRLVFSTSHKYRGLQQALDTSRTLMQTARMTGLSFWRLWIKTVPDKKVVFAWFRKVIQTNDSLTNMLQADLLSSDGIVQLASSWRFLLGLSSTIASLCSDSMKQRVEKKGKDAFDCRYLDQYDMVDDRYRLVSSDKVPDAAAKKKPEALQFDGATEFFFLSAALLHVSLYPMMRVENAFLRQYNKLLVMLQDMEKKKSPVPPHLQTHSKNAVVAWRGYDAFMDDPEWISKMTPLALTQLQWIRSIVIQKDSCTAKLTLAQLPDWFCKEPARWLAHVARKVPTSLAVHQADLAVDVTTQLLTAGSQDKSTFSFSPLVLTELIHVASAFVEAGARRAKRKRQFGRRRRGIGGAQNEQEHDGDDDKDDDDLGVYLSLDQNDLGVAVFTNRRVCGELCPTLLKTFRALDHIEGLNVDAEASFDKFSVKVEIARLLIRLWRHPNGECKKSIVGLPADEISRFASSIAAAIGCLLDDACQRYSGVVKLSRRDPRTLSPQDRAFLEKQTRGAVNGFLCGRTFLLLLHRLSEVDVIAGAIGGGSSARGMASMLVHFLDILTDPDGGTHRDLDVLPQQNRTSSMLQQSERMLAGEKAKLASDVVATRRKTKQTIGLDVAETAHMFLALATRWFTTSKNGTNSALISALASLDDCDPAKYRFVAQRLILPNDSGLESDPAGAAFRHDGYVDASMFSSDANDQHLTEIQRSLMQSARKCHMSHEEISSLAQIEQVHSFLDAVQSTKEKLTKGVELRADDAAKVLEKIMSPASFSSESEYGDVLSSWTVSSESFADKKSGSSFLHYFDKTVRDRGTPGTGKALVKEARKCHKGIPVPHPNSAIFVCFAEERMDLCRAVVLGPVETPYSLGAFVFDVYFPPSYPHIPPLVQFMTTGGGQVRFGPNLYQDGKVCLSLLGTFHAGDESQQWNPRVSSLAQILLSIQTQLFVNDPYFLEPGNEAMMNTSAGKDVSEKYNMRRRLDTLRHAILEPLTEPPLGFKEVLKKHFARCRQRIVVQARRWTLEARGTQLESRFEKVYGQILSCLVNDLDPELLQVPPLEPLEEDVQYIVQNDPTFFLGKGYAEKKQSAAAAASWPSTTLGNTSNSNSPWGADFNPWEAEVSAVYEASQAAAADNNNGDEDVDDDFYT